MLRRLSILGLSLIISSVSFTSCNGVGENIDSEVNENDYVISNDEEIVSEESEKSPSLKKSDYMMMPVKAILSAFYFEDDYKYDVTDPASFWKTMDYFTMLYGEPMGGDDSGREIYEEFTIKQYASVLFGKGGNLPEISPDDPVWVYDENKHVYIKEPSNFDAGEVVIFDMYAPGNGYTYILAYVDRENPEDIEFYNVVLTGNKYENRGEFKYSAVYSKALDDRKVSLEDGTYYTSTKAIARIEDDELILTCRIDQSDSLYQNYRFEGKHNFPVTLINGDEKYGDILSEEEFNEIFNAHHKKGDFNMRIMMEDEKVDSIIVAEQTYE
ncbi:MAG: hypothetical protein J6033_05480 [Lachnospiraceae bacterium]|nr:hypothetical protein [Lachnospiraceae bacterium]